MDTNFYKMDLHIHTPASKCYTGSKNDEEYFEILRVAHKQNLDIIAITDHNTIAGYEHLFALKSELQDRINILSEFQDSATQINDALNEYKEKLSLFKDILIIPGVELTLNPGIHMLVLSTPDKLCDLSALLNSIGYTEDKRGADSGIEINVDIKNFLANPSLNDFIVIAPHIDSNKGIYNSLDGQFRADIMRSESIIAFSCNALTQKEKIIKLFKSDPSYKRKSIPAFINCSDAHNSNDVGKKFSYIKLDELSLNQIQLTFLSPEGRISDTSDQRLEKSIHKLINEEAPLLISDPALINTNDLSHCICACLNEGINYILLGVTSNKDLIGLKNVNIDFKELVSEAINLVDSNYTHLGFSVTIEILGNGNNIAIIYLKPIIDCLWYISKTEEVYVLNNSVPSIAKINEIEAIVYKNILSEMEALESRNNFTAQNISSQLLSLKNGVNKYDIIRRIMLDSIPIMGVCNIKAYTSASITEEMSKKYLANNGECNGNTYFVSKNSARLPDAILRFSCPSTNLPCDLLEALNLPPVLPNSIIISQNGGAHIATSNKNIMGNEANYLIVSSKQNEDTFPFVLLAWLKSSLFTWFTLKKYNTTNIFLPEIFQDIIFPYRQLVDATSEIVNIIQNIISLENTFVAQASKKDICEKCQKCGDDNCLLNTMANEHNENISKKMRIVDKIIFDALDIDENEQNLISEDLDAAGIYNIMQ